MFQTVLLVIICTLIDSSSSITFVKTPSYPTIPEAPLNNFCLNLLAVQYVAETRRPDRSNPDFAFVYVPVRVFRAIKDQDYSGILGCTEDDLLGILYWGGYWGGIWLRARLQNLPVAGNDTELRAVISTAIQDTNTAANSANPIPYLSSQIGVSVGSFAYNCGYLRTIIDSPPQGVQPDPRWNFVYNPQRALDATYTTPLVGLTSSDSAWIETLNTNSNYGTTKNLIINQIQPFSYQQGVIAWSNATGLNVVGLKKADYNLLLKTSAAFLELAQTAALRITESVTTQNIDKARITAKYWGFLRTLNLAYRFSLLYPIYDSDRPNTPFPKIRAVRV